MLCLVLVCDEDCGYANENGERKVHGFDDGYLYFSDLPSSSSSIVRPLSQDDKKITHFWSSVVRARWVVLEYSGMSRAHPQMFHQHLVSICQRLQIAKLQPQATQKLDEPIRHSASHNVGSAPAVHVSTYDITSNAKTATTSSRISCELLLYGWYMCETLCSVTHSLSPRSKLPNSYR